MTDLRESPWETHERRSRRRAIAALMALAVVAILVVALMPKYLRADPGKPSARTSVIFEQPSSTPPSAAKPSGSASPSAQASATPTPSPSGPPCQGNPCAVPGDAGNALAAVNNYRSAHGEAPVPGSVSDMAAQCALAQGGGPSCRPHYAWETLPTQDGQRCVQLVGERTPNWLLDPGMQSFSVGWAYDPAQQQWYCALLKVG